MEPLSEKRYLELHAPAGGDFLAARERLLAALPDGCRLTLGCLQQLYPVLSAADYRVTVTLCPGPGGTDAVRVEPGDTTAEHYGLCLDIGSTIMQMELVDLVRGRTLSQAACTNSQTQFGANILDRILAVKADRENLKLDTGMTRIGFFAYDNERTLDELRQVAQLPHLHIEGVFMHFCVADSRAEADVSFTKLQYKRFMDMLSAMAGVGIRPEIRHCCNSGATILYPEFALDMVRPGIITYGNAPSDELEGALSLRPMMSLHSMIAQVRTVPAGTDISYGRLYRTKEETRVAVLPIGYADGLSRLLTGKASFYLQGHQVPVIGRICMDMCMIDVSGVPEAKPGDVVTIFGYDDDGTLLPCERLARAQGTINYELLCQISKRIPRICHRGAETSQILQYIV